MFRLLVSSLCAFSIAGCTTGEITGSDRSPSEPESFSSAMFDQEALAGYELEQRAYVQGHAVAIYLYGKTLPGYTGYTGYVYEPGHSAQDARVPYVWSDIVLSRSGGTDGAGRGIAYSGGDDVGCEGDDCDTEDPPGETDPCDDTEPPPDGDTEPPPDGDTEPPPGGEECPPDGPIDPDCEEFLDPAAMDARELAQRVDVLRVLGEGYPADTTYERAFRRGMAEALYLQDLHEDTDHSEVEALKHDVQDNGMCEHSPLVVDLEGDGIAVSRAGDGVAFDLLGRGAPLRTAWPHDDALLALDWNGDGAINDGRELFGNARGDANGFDALAVLDRPAHGGNGDGVVDADDALFARLVLWRDADRDGTSDAGELSALADEGIVAIDLAYAEVDQRDAAGNRFDQHGAFIRLDGGRYVSGDVIDVWFKTRALDR